MCSVVGYVGSQYSRKVVLEGLSRLEYRGYDSAGFACINPNDKRIMYAKSPGKLTQLLAVLDKAPIDGAIGIGHTRWSTHGSSSEQNAHPHFDCQKQVSVVHNGIIENHHELKRHLENAGHTFHSDTDTEMIAHLFEVALELDSDLVTATTNLVSQLNGAYAFISLVQQYPDTMLVVRKRSPLCIGIGDGQMYVASDMLAFAGKTRNVIYMPDDSFALVTKESVALYQFDGTPLSAPSQEIDITWDMYEKQGHDHFMLKEIYEQKAAIHDTVDFLYSTQNRIWDEMGISAQQIRELNTLNLIGCGTSWHAGYIARFFFETIAEIPTYLHLASEFRYLPFFSTTNSIYCAISQSGETADTLQAVRMINKMDMPTVALTNVSSSTMVREAGGFLLTQAGREIAVASTKAFSTQITALYWLAHYMAYEKGLIAAAELEAAQEDLLITAEVLENTIEKNKRSIIKDLAAQYAPYKKMVFLGRHNSYPFALESALKLKEIAYIFSLAYPAGELKHGPLALIDAETPTIIFSHQDPIIYQKLLGNVQEVKARGGHVIAFVFEGQKELHDLADTAFEIPRVNSLLGPLAMTGLMQFFFYAIAKELDRPIDKPRNLAKSVTVE